MKRIVVPIIMLVAVGVATSAWASMYTGSITNGDGLYGTLDWGSGASLSWSVDDTTNIGYWTYDYTFAVTHKKLSHIIFELSPGLDYVIDGTRTPYVIGTYSSESGGNSNYGMPWAGNGIKFTDFAEGTSWTMLIVSDRAPMWGDFYAIDGKKPDEEVYAYNTLYGQTGPVDVGDGNAGGLVLVPDTAVVPIPSAVWLLGSGLIGLVGLRRRYKT